MLGADDWKEILKAIERFTRRNPSIEVSKVISVDASARTIRVEKFRDKDIPIFGFNYEITNTVTPESPASLEEGVDLSGTEGTGSPYQRTSAVAPAMPNVGDRVLLALSGDKTQIPKCIGVDLRRGVSYGV